MIPRAIAPLLNTAPEAVIRSPLALVGTAEECITELRRRASDWGVTQFIFAGVAEKVARKLWEQVLAHVPSAGSVTGS